MMERPLGDLNLVALMMDGIEFQDYLLVVAMGFDATGKKHILGLWDGATENAVVCGALLDELIERGLATDRRYLFVLDGSKALRKAVLTRFGDNAEIHRCHLHKTRNVLSYLSNSYHRIVEMKLIAAWGMMSYADAKNALRDVVTYLRTISESAARSLEEGFEDTLTIHRLGLPDRLRVTFKSTNPIESCFSTTKKKFCKNVKNWKNVDMARRWAGTMLLESEKRFRRIRGYKEMPVLISAMGREVDIVRKSA